MQLASSISKGRFVGATVFFSLLLAYFLWGALVQVTADARDGEYLLWIHDADASPGGDVVGRVQLSTLREEKLQGLTVELGGARRWFSGEGTDHVDFVMKVPERARAGDMLLLEMFGEDLGGHTAIAQPENHQARSLARTTFL